MNPLKQAYWYYRKQRIKKLIQTKERSFGEEYPVKYVLERHRSDVLVIVYSAFPELKKPAVYNYLTALFKCRANKLFLLDEYGMDGAGCFGLAAEGNFCVRENVRSIIEQAKRETGATRIYHVGSSKGGWIALYYGLEDPSSTLVLGAPIYRAGTYFNVCMPEQFGAVLGMPHSSESVRFLDALTVDKVRSNHTQKVYLHYSDKEHFYVDQVQYLLADLQGQGYDLTEDVAHYPEHREVGLYFAEYLRNFFKTIR